MTNETQSSPAAGSADALREVVEDIKGRSKLLSVHDIYKSFGTNAVLKGISLEVDHGEVLALIGGNGAGKSTLMKIIMGIYSADSGDVVIDGDKVDISNPKAALAHSIYMVPQEPMLFPRTSPSASRKRPTSSTSASRRSWARPAGTWTSSARP